MHPTSIDRAHALLRLSPERDGYEVYAVGRIETAPPFGTGYLCPACSDVIGPNQRFRQIRTRQAGTAWTARMIHEVHEACWLKASTAAGLQAILDRMHDWQTDDAGTRWCRAHRTDHEEDGRAGEP